MSALFQLQHQMLHELRTSSFWPGQIPNSFWLFVVEAQMLLPLIPSPLYLKGFLHLLKCSFKIAKYCSGSGTNNSPYSFLSHFSSDCITLLFFYLLCGLKYFFSAMSIYKNVLKSLYFFSFLCHIDCPYQFFLCLYISFLATTFHQFLPTLTFSF